jgi:predicted dehydrogenase
MHNNRSTVGVLPMRPRIVISLLCSISALATDLANCEADDKIRVAIVGTDTSHCLAFTQLINSPDAKGPLSRVRIVAAYPGGSPDIAASRDRVQQFAKQLQPLGVEIVDSAEAAAARADAILLESVDGRKHLEQFRQIASGKPVFVDKPAAASVADFIVMMQIAERTHTPFFSSSALRFCPELQLVATDQTVGNVLAAATSTPYQTEPHHPDLFWYGIHGVESLATLLGPGCEQVQRRDTRNGVLLVGSWHDGRQGAVWALATTKPVYSFTLYGDKAVASANGFSGYANLVEKICRFFVTRQAPVQPAETLEILAMMEAADESRRLSGKPVSIASVVARARKEVSNREISK